MTFRRVVDRVGRARTPGREGALDLRLVPVALSAWGAAAWGVGWTPGHAVAGALALLGLAALLTGRHAAGPPHGRRRSGGAGGAGWVGAVAGAAAVAAAALAVAGLRVGAAQVGPVSVLAEREAYVTVVGTVSSDPVVRTGPRGEYVLVRVTLTEVTGRGATTRVRSPVLVVADLYWRSVRYGESITGAGRLRPSDGPDLAGVLLARGAPNVRSEAGVVTRAIAQVRNGLTESASVLPPAERSLVPALVDGDDSQMPAEVADQFRETGLTHLLAVSGANLTLMLGFVLLVARWCGVRGRGHLVVGLGAVVFFVLLARPQPSVLRAAAMGVVGIVGLSTGGQRRGVRTLCVAVVVLLLLDPWLARSAGFILSVLATAGIVVLAPGWRDRLTRWLPRPIAEAVSVPLAAQLVCTPVVAAISGQVSLVAVISNLLAAPAVAPATVLGLLGGLVALVNDPVAHLVGRVAGVPAWWIVTVAERGAAFDGASLDWPAGVVGVGLLGLLCAVIALALPAVLSRRSASLAVTLLLVVAVLRPTPTPGWPPDRWVAVMCDVGQGDAVVLRVAPRTAIVIDAGMQPGLVDRCLDDLGVKHVPLLVLTHFHADHVGGLPGVLNGRDVAAVLVSPLDDPASTARDVQAEVAAAGARMTRSAVGQRWTVGGVRLEVLGPVDVPILSGRQPGEAANDASVVIVADVGGVRVLLAGDAEPAEERGILATAAERLDVDVLKVAHHGSANQDTAFVQATSPAVALISVGADNEYGHPAADTLRLLGQLGTDIYRTDVDGDIALVVEGDALIVHTSD